MRHSSYRDWEIYIQDCSTFLFLKLTGSDTDANHLSDGFSLPFSLPDTFLTVTYSFMRPHGQTFHPTLSISIVSSGWWKYSLPNHPYMLLHYSGLRSANYTRNFLWRERTVARLHSFRYSKEGALPPHSHTHLHSKWQLEKHKRN